MYIRFRAELTVGLTQRARAKVTVVEDPQASLPDYILHSTLCYAFTKTLEPLPAYFTSALSHFEAFFTLVLFFLFSLLSLFIPLSVLSCVYKTLIQISLKQQVYAPISGLSCFALSSSGWFLHRPRYKLILEFCPWFPPISPWALTCQCCPPLGSMSCCNYLWHSGSGALRTGDKVEGWVGAEDERGKGGSLFAHNSCLSSHRN